MNPLPDLDSLERNAFRCLFSDGLFDIALGLWLVSWSLLIMAGNVVLGAFLMIALILLWERARRRVTLPRLGEVRYRHRSKNVRLALMVTVCVALLGLGILLAVTRGSGPRGMEDFLAAQSHLLLAIPLALLLAALAAVFRVSRLLVDAAVLLAFFALGDPLGLRFPASMTAAGVTILAIGSLTLVRFLRSHPAEAVAHDVG